MTTNVAKFQKDYPAERKPPVKLNADAKYMLYKYVVEHHCIAQEGELYKFRVPPKIIAAEINEKHPKLFEGKKISPYHIKDSVEDVIDWQIRLNKLPAVPIETADIEQLKIFKTKAINEIEDLKYQLQQAKADLDANVKSYRTEIERLNKNSDALKYKKIKEFIGGL